MMREFYEAEEISILSNRDGWTDGDLKTLKEIIEIEDFEVVRADQSRIQKAEFLIPTLTFILGLWLYPFFQAFFSEFGKDAYQKLKEFIVKRLKNFQENFDKDSFHKIEFFGKYEGIYIEIAINANDQDVINEAFERINEVFPLIKSLIDEFYQRNEKVKRISVIYSARRGKWELNIANFANGTQEFGELYHHKESLEYV